MKPLLKAIKRRWLIMCICAGIVGSSYYLLHEHYLYRSLTLGSDFVYAIESRILDFKLRLRGPERPKHKVGILAIDEKSIMRFGEWPFSRKYYAKALENLKSLGVKQVGFDVIFADPQPTPLKDLKTSLSAMRLALKTRDAQRLGQSLSRLEEYSEASLNDQVLAQSIGETNFVVLGYYLLMSELDAQKEFGQQKKLYFNRFETMSDTAVGYDMPEGKTLESYINLSKAHAINSNLDQVTEAGNQFAFFSNSPDDDAINRWVTLVANVNGELMPSLTLKMAANHLNAEPIVFFNDLGVESLTLVDNDDDEISHEIATDPDGAGRVLTNVRGPSKSFKHFSLSDAYFESYTDQEKEDLKNMSLILAGTAKGTNDQRPNAFDPAIDGAENHAAALDNILAGDFLKRNVKIYEIERLQILFCGLIFAPIFIWGSSILSAFAMLMFIGGFLAFDWQYWFIGQGVWSYVFFPCFEVASMFVCSILFKYFTEEREKKQVKGAFSHYLSPDVIDQVLDDPDALALGGTRLEITTLFSDVRGFTTISESLTPEQLVQFMNEYFNPMTGLVMDSGGTLDKYIGDAIMAFWGAPLPMEDHTKRAASAAIKMLYALDILQEEMVAKGFPKPEVGIGLNTGPASVGNMGSDVRFSYTAMGDSVNLASRLEGLTKSYKIKIMISEFTAKRLERSEFYYRDLDDIRVKGKTEPVRVFELLRYDYLKTADDMVSFIQDFETGRELYRNQEWDLALEKFKNCLQQRLDDGPAQLYIERCETYKKNPPVNKMVVGGDSQKVEWDGVFNFDHK